MDNYDQDPADDNEIYPRPNPLAPILEKLKTPADIADYLNNAVNPDDPSKLFAALGIAAHTRNISHLSRDMGITRQGFNKAFAAKGNPCFVTVQKLCTELGISISFTPLPEHNSTDSSEQQ